ncbi:2-hydroxyacid dehydrogenase [Paenarthrobacter sp. NPDC089714]|uniref:2-hydroxyacid dehydrogenase n=1 Tax=unclassified Paenarthrobacter TaxID=2634190 RepID=UPI00380C22B2
MAYRVAITNGYAALDGSTIFGDIGLSALTDAGLEWQVLPEPVDSLRAAELEDFDAVLVMGPERITDASLQAPARLRHVARFGAGYDAIDVAACTRHGVVLTNTPDAVRRPVADAAVALLFALAHNLVVKDRLVREGRWNEREDWHGSGLDGATVGIVGFGGIGQETARRVKALGLRTVAWNRSDRSAEAAGTGVELMSLENVLATSDFVIVTVAGNTGTRHLIGHAELEMMKPGARLINLARGSVIDEEAMIARLADGRLAGAGLDVFEREPLPRESPLVAMDNVILAPHSLCWTESFTKAVSGSVMSSIIDASRGKTPANTVNPEAWANAGKPALAG